MKIAIVGSGIAGLSAAHHLHRAHDITVFEAGGHVGGHVDTHNIPLGGRNYAVDTGFIVFNDWTYPNFIALLEAIEAPSQPSEMSFSVSCARTDMEYNGNTLNSLFVQRRNLIRPGFWGMLRDILRFNTQAPRLLESPGEEIGLGDYLAEGGYGDLFRDYYILPMGAAIWSTDPARMLQFPARFFIRFMINHGLLSVNNRPVWRVIQGGSQRYVEKLTAPFAGRIRTNTPVLGVSRHARHVEIRLADGCERFDALFMACHSDQALRLLDTPTAIESAVLSAIPYQANEAVLHTDTRLLPKRRGAWAAWNYRMPDGPGGKVSLTYNMNILQGLDAPETLCVTLNASDRIDPARILKRITYQHPLFTPQGVAAQARQREVNGTGGVYYCGAWWRNGFHEDAVVSALEALRHFQEDLEQPSLRHAA